MIVDQRLGFSGLIRILVLGLAVFCQQLKAQPADTVLMPIKTLRVSLYVFQDDNGERNFNKDSAGQVAFLHQLTDWVNHRFANLDTLRPAMPSAFIADSRVRIRLDTIYFHRDTRAWDCSADIDGPYMRDQYVDADSLLNYQQKYQTLPIFIGGNYQVIGGHSRNIGDRGYIAVRGFYEKYLSLPNELSVDECGRNLVHEIGHCIGLSHNFTGGPGGDQCDECEDNGCPAEGTSNNLMDYWPSFGYALSGCQFKRIQFCLSGGEGNISEAVINDSCYRVSGVGDQVSGGDTVVIKDTVYAHEDWLIKSGGLLRVTGYLSMPIDSKIVLEPGARLEIDKGTIGNLCGDLWQGVQTDTLSGPIPATISIINGGAIENARTGIMAWGPVRAELDNSVLRNCEESLVFLRGSVDTITVRNCSFRITDKLNHYEEGIAPVSFLRSEGVSRLTVSGSLFINEPGTRIYDANWMGSGILSDARSVDIRNSEFINLTCGLNLFSKTGESRIDIIGNRFVNNRFGLRTDYSGIQWIEDNQFILQRYNSGPTVGLLLNHPDRFAVYRNNFESVFGGGKLAGMVITEPEPENSPVFSNVFSNLPIGVFMDNPPEIDASLLTWAKNMGAPDRLRLGPQLRFNLFDTVGIKFAIVSDSIFGSAIVDPGSLYDEESRRATQWTPGGFFWYDQKLPMVAFPGWKQGDPVNPGHNLYWFMNLPGISSSEKIIDWTWNSELGQYLNRLASFPDSAEWFFDSGIYPALERIKKIPAALRSSKYSVYWERFRAEEDLWIRESLGSISGHFVSADSLLTDLGTSMAHQSLASWAHSQPRDQKDIAEGLNTGFDFSFDFPEMRTFRFGGFLKPESPPPGFLIYPNPAQDYIIVQPQEGYSFGTGWTGHITSSDGRYSSEIIIASWQDQKLNISGLPSGLYIIEFYNGNKYLGAVKFIKITHS